MDRWHKAFKTKQEANGAEAYFRVTGRKPAGDLNSPMKTFASIAEELKQSSEGRDTDVGQDHSFIWLRGHGDD